MTFVLGAFLILTIASVIRTAAGFGFALVAVPPFTFLVEPSTAVVIAALMSLPISLWTAIRYRQHIERKIAGIALVAGLLGVPIGIWLLHALQGRALALLISGVVLTCTIVVWRRVTIPPRVPLIAVISVFSGASFASTGIDGPPMVAAMQSLRLQPQVQRATLGVVFSCTGLAALAGYSLSGKLTQQVGLGLIIGIPALFAGIYIGERIFARFDAERFRRAVLLLLIASSVSVIVKIIV
ncbi:MAG: sulfite exporter TauE/SafE family protein [Segniliparus sp.]|uniref:sulfite exporter TauE/SafE family protein n=1 Tax=Segniliparus sp. TaxID=2804064 RepID=UPI003F412AB5